MDMNKEELLNTKIEDINFGDTKHTDTLIKRICVSHRINTVRDLISVRLSSMIKWRLMGSHLFEVIIDFLQGNGLLFSADSLDDCGSENMETIDGKNMENNSTDVWEKRRYETAQKIMLTMYEKLQDGSFPIPYDWKGSINHEGIAKESVSLADALISKLKEGGVL